MTLQNIFKQLRSGNANYFKMLSNYNNSDWIWYAKYNKYVYHPQIIYHDNISKVKVITWMPSQGTEVHAHPEYNECYFKILKGKLYEDVYDKNTLEVLKSKKYNYNDIGYGANSHIHRITNIGKEPAVSLHIYSLNDKDEIERAYQECFINMVEQQECRQQIIQRMLI